MTPRASARATVYVSGRVQGVGFRDWVRRRASGLGLAGYATNLRDGRVEVVVEGPREDVDTLLGAMHDGEAPGAVGQIDARWEDAAGDLSGFGVR